MPRHDLGDTDIYIEVVYWKTFGEGELTLKERKDMPRYHIGKTPNWTSVDIAKAI